MDGTADTATCAATNGGVVFNQSAFSLDTAGSATNPFHSILTLNGGTVSMNTNNGLWTLVGGTINMNQSAGIIRHIAGGKLVLGSGAAIGTINVGASSAAQIDAPLQSAATSVAGGESH